MPCLTTPIAICLQPQKLLLKLPRLLKPLPPPDAAPSAPPSVEPQVGSVPSPASFKTKPDFGKHSVPAYQMPDDTPWKQTWRIFQARLQSLSEQVGRRLTQRTLKIGVSARIFHPESGAKGLQAKTLQYLEESIAALR